LSSYFIVKNLIENKYNFSFYYFSIEWFCFPLKDFKTLKSSPGRFSPPLQSAVEGTIGGDSANEKRERRRVAALSPGIYEFLCGRTIDWEEGSTALCNE
jgi:hypothetical protein